MAHEPNLQRFLDAQATAYAPALAELRAGRKRSHWMWYVFPQIQGLGFSSISQRYALADLAEAAAYLAHPVLGARLRRACDLLLEHGDRTAYAVLGTPDDLKLRSSMTLFAQVPGASPVFQQVLDAFFGGQPDGLTLQRLG